MVDPGRDKSLQTDVFVVSLRSHLVPVFKHPLWIDGVEVLQLQYVYYDLYFVVDFFLFAVIMFYMNKTF